MQDGHHPVRRDHPLHRRPLRLVRLEVPQEEEAKRGKIVRAGAITKSPINMSQNESNKQVEKPTKDDEDALVGNEEIKEEVGRVSRISPYVIQNAPFTPFSELLLQKPMPPKRQGICSRCL